MFAESSVDCSIPLPPAAVDNSKLESTPPATIEGQDLCAGDVAKMAQSRGYNVSARVHTYLYGNEIGV